MNKQRILLLYENQVIGKETKQITLQVIHYCIDHFKWKDDELLAVFITHLAMAHHRMIHREVIDPVGDLIVQQLKSNEAYSKAYNWLDQLQKAIYFRFNLVEANYLLLHLCNIANQLEVT